MSLNGTYHVELYKETDGFPFYRYGDLILKEMGPWLSGYMFPLTMWLSAPFSGGYYKENEFRFKVYFSTPCQQYEMEVSGIVEEDTLTGTVIAPTGEYRMTGKKTSCATDAQIK